MSDGGWLPAAAYLINQFSETGKPKGMLGLFTLGYVD
jgi:hypothetical protein